jgi:hypothetical protein
VATYELWNVESGNLLGTFPDETAALEAVAEAIERNGATYVDVLALGRESSRGASKIIASGSQLADRAAHRGQTAATATRRRRAPGN